MTPSELAAVARAESSERVPDVVSDFAERDSALGLLVALGKTRTVLAQAPVEELFGVLARATRQLTDAMAVTVSALADSDLVEALSGQAVVGPSMAGTSRVGVAARVDWPRSFVVRASIGEVDLSASLTTSMVNFPVEVAGVRIGTVTLLSQEGPFTSLEAEATRQLVAVMADRLRGSMSAPATVRTQSGPAQEDDWQLWEWAQDGVVVTTGDDHRIARATTAFCQILGLDPADAVGTPLDWSRFDVEYQDGTPVPVAELPPVRALRTGVSQPPVILRVADDTVPGHKVAEWIRVAASPVVHLETGEVLEIRTWLRNITRERRLVHRLSNANRRLESARRVSDMVWWSFDAAIGLRCSDGARGHLGLRDNVQFPDLPTLLSWAHPDDVAEIRARLDDEPVAGDRCIDLPQTVVRVVPPDGRRRYFRVCGRVEKNAEGKVIGASGTAFDATDEFAIRAELDVSMDLFQRAFERAPIGMALIQTSTADRGRIIRVNPEFTRMLGYQADRELLGKHPLEYIALEDVPLLRKQLLELQQGSAKTLHEEITLLARDGTPIRCLISATSSGVGSPYVLCHVQDMTGRETAVRATVAGERLFQVAFDDAPIGMMVVTMAPGREGQAVLVNQAMVDLVRRPLPSLLGATPGVFMAPEEAEASMQSLRDAMEHRSTGQREQRQLTRSDGEVVHSWVSTMVVDEASPGGPLVLFQFVDVTAVRGQQKALERMALTDSLTRLPNRSLFAARVDQALSRMFPGTKLALMVLDLDRFKNVNDGLGHHVGDLLLVEVAARLTQIQQPGLTVARQGGDEFTVLVEGLTDDYEVVSIAEHLLEILTEEYLLGDSHLITTSASIGVAVADDPSSTREQLLREADLALYAAKASGRNRFVLCGDELLDAAARREDSEQRLRRGLANDQLRVMLQPIVNLSDGQLKGMEALVRVQDPEVGLLNPSDIIGVAEDAGMIGELDRRVMDESVRLVTVDPRFTADRSTRVSINVSGRTLEQPGLARHLAAALARHRVPGNRIVIELTESSLLKDDPLVLQAVMGLKRLGAEIGIDDFGTGYSALAYLEKFDLDFLKIDRSFVSRIIDPPDRRAVATVAAIIELAHAHGLRVTAEGIETEFQAQTLRDLGCDAGQGWLLGEPTSTEPTERQPPLSSRDDLETEF